MSEEKRPASPLLNGLCDGSGIFHTSYKTGRVVSGYEQTIGTVTDCPGCLLCWRAKMEALADSWEDRISTHESNDTNGTFVECANELRELAKRFPKEENDA